VQAEDEGEQVVNSGITMHAQSDLTSAKARAEKGVSGGGLITVVHPAAKAAPSLRVIMAEGKFHGVKIALQIFSIAVCVHKSKTYTTPA